MNRGGAPDARGRGVTDYLIDAADLVAVRKPSLHPWTPDGISVATGTPAFGTAAIPEPGPVVYVIEESGKRAL